MWYVGSRAEGGVIWLADQRRRIASVKQTKFIRRSCCEPGLVGCAPRVSSTFSPCLHAVREHFFRFLFFVVAFFHYFYPSAQLFVGFTLTDLLDKPWSQVSSLPLPLYLPSPLSRIGFSIPTARRLSSNVANSRSRAFRESLCAQEKVPTNLYEYALGGTRAYAIGL